MLAWVEGEEACAVAADHRFGSDHLGVQPSLARQQAMKHAAMRVRPFHHRRDAEAVRVHAHLLAHFRRPASLRISRAALWPGAPVTPPPGWVPAPHM